MTNGAPAKFRNIEVVAISLLCFLVSLASGTYLSPRWGWCGVAIAMIVFLLFLGRWVSGRPMGVLINERNLFSLSRFQMVSWTVLLLSAFLAVALKRLHVLPTTDTSQPLNIAMGWQLWALMGISTTSLVGTPLLLSSKTDQAPDPKTLAKAASALGESSTEIQANSQGTLYSNPSLRDASFSDMFQGDEVGNTAYVDLSKVQMFFFSAVSIVAYAYATYSALGDVYPQKAFLMPTPPDALVALMGISHAAYLTSKTTSHG